MVNLYATLIINKRKLFEEVPVSLQEAVEVRLREMGYDTEGELI